MGIKWIADKGGVHSPGEVDPASVYGLWIDGRCFDDWDDDVLYVLEDALAGFHVAQLPEGLQICPVEDLYDHMAVMGSIPGTLVWSGGLLQCHIYHASMLSEFRAEGLASLRRTMFTYLSVLNELQQQAKVSDVSLDDHGDQIGVSATLNVPGDVSIESAVKMITFSGMTFQRKYRLSWVSLRNTRSGRARSCSPSGSSCQS